MASEFELQADVEQRGETVGPIQSATSANLAWSIDGQRLVAAVTDLKRLSEALDRDFEPGG